MRNKKIFNQFKFIEADFPELEDDSYEFIDDPNFHIQCCEDGQFLVQQWNECSGTDHDGSHFDHSTIQAMYSCNSLGSAMKFIINLNIPEPEPENFTHSDDVIAMCGFNPAGEER